MYHVLKNTNQWFVVGIDTSDQIAMLVKQLWIL